MGAGPPPGSGETERDLLLDPKLKAIADCGLAYILSAGETVAFTVRVPDGMWAKLKAQAIRSTLQVLVEHALLLYLGGRPPPNALRGQLWQDGTEGLLQGEYEPKTMRQIATRLPKAMVRWAKVYAAEADISDQELAVRAFDWYLRTGKIPPKKEDVERTVLGFLRVPDKLIGLEFRMVADDQLPEVEETVEERLTGPADSGQSPQTTTLGGAKDQLAKPRVGQVRSRRRKTRRSTRTTRAGPKRPRT